MNISKSAGGFLKKLVTEKIIYLVLLALILVILLIVCHRQQFQSHPVHTLYACSEESDFLLSLIDRDFRSFHQTALYISEASVLLTILLGLDDFADQFFYLRYEADEDGSIDEVETSMESSEHETQLCCVSEEVGRGVCHLHIISDK